MATKLLICSALALVLATSGGCSPKPEGPNYEALRSELAERLDPIEGWAAMDLEPSADHLEGIRRSKVTNLVWRSYKSDISGQEVRLQLVGGQRRHISRYAPDCSSCMVRRNYDDPYFETLTSRSGAAYAFSCVAQVRPDHRHLVWAHTLGGGWTRNGFRVALGGDPYGFTVSFEIDSPPNKKPEEISADVERLIGEIMDQINPAVIAHHLDSAREFAVRTKD